MCSKTAYYDPPVTLLPGTTLSRDSTSSWTSVVTSVVLNRSENFSGYDWADLYFDVTVGPPSNAIVELYMGESTSRDDNFMEHLASIDVPAGATGLFYIGPLYLYSKPGKILPIGIKFLVRSSEEIEVGLKAVPVYYAKNDC